MDIKYAILGFLSWKPFTGYELKKVMVDSPVFYWSGNNNQIYTTLVQLHKDGLVTNEVQHQEHLPSRKIYTVTDKGLESLKTWLISEPELSQARKPFLVQLAWSNQLSASDLNGLIVKYENEVNLALKILNEQERRGVNLNPARSSRETIVWRFIYKNFIRSYEAELVWICELRNELAKY
jgi:PadR family transcriptional regulator, regulatory protein AphA